MNDNYGLKIAIVGACCILTMAAQAGTPTSQDSEPEEIVVTARKQDEKLQDVPDSISVLTETTIENAGIRTIEDIAQLTPNVVVMQGLKPGFLTLTARGISTIQENEAPMAVVIDGVTVPAIDFISQDLIDLQQVEVLRGPQGSLYGANALAGAIVVTTKEPTNNFEGRGKVSFGNAGYRGGSGVLSGPIVTDKLFFRVAATYRDDDGTIKNQYDDRNVDFYRETTFRGQLRWLVTDDVTVDLRAKYLDSRAGAVYNTVTNAAEPGQINDFKQIFMDYNTQGVDNRKLHDASLKVDWRLAGGSGGTLTSITGYAKTTDAVYGEADWLCACYTWLNLTGLPPFLYDTAQDWRVSTKAYNQELRYSASIGNWLQFQVGAFYQNRKRDASLVVGGDGGGHIASPVFIETLDHPESRQLAFFGQATINLTKALDLTLGARNDADRRSSYSKLPPGPFKPPFVENTFRQFQPKVSLAYHWSDELMTYATFAKGFRSGGFNASATMVDGVLYPREYSSETATDYEAGFKAELASHRVVFNGAVFHIEYNNMQFFFPTLQGQILTNFPKAAIDGMELEFTGKLTDSLQITSSYGISNAKILAADSAGAFGGNRIPKVNEYTLGAGVQYESLVGSSGLEYVARVDFERRGPIYWDVANTLRTSDRDYLNVRMGLKFHNWELTAYGRNITNTRQPVEVIQNFPPYGINANVSRPNLERRIGFELGLRFD